MSDAEKLARIQLNQIIPPRQLKEAINAFGSAENVITELKERNKFNVRKAYDQLPNDFENCLFLGEADFPKRLAQIPDCPLVLYLKGDRALLNKKKIVGIVGTRKPSNYGADVVKKLIAEAVSIDVVTISGMAFGIDSEVHKQTLDLKGQTIAVLGSGVLKASPENNSWLYDRIIAEGGLVVSEYYNIDNYNKWVFPRRNRIIAGIADQIIVVEAQMKSGALITADLAYGYERDVFVTPGSIFSQNSMGCNQLIKQDKARLLTSLADIFPEKFNNKLSGADARMLTNNGQKSLIELSASSSSNIFSSIGRGQIHAC